MPWPRLKSVFDLFYEIIKGVVYVGKSITALVNDILSFRPVEFMKTLIDKEDPHSSHNFVNLMWGVGSFVFFWAEHFYKIFTHLPATFTVVDYGFIGTMAGISTISAIMSKKVDLIGGTQDPPDPPSIVTPPIIQTQTTTTQVVTPTAHQPEETPNAPF